MIEKVPDRSVDWKISFRLEDRRVFITDKCILIDDRYVMPALLPPDGRTGHYRQVRQYLALPELERFSYRDMKMTEWGNFEGPDGLTLNRKYIEFLRERIADEHLRFAMTDRSGGPVWIYRGEEALGLLMPMTKPPAFGHELKEQARAGNAEAQYYMGRYYRVQDGPVPRNDILSRKWLEAAAEQNHPKANMDLGLYHIYGWGGTDDRETAIRFFDRAIELGCREAIHWRYKLMQRRMHTRSEFMEAVRKWLEEEEGSGSEEAP